MLNFWGKHVGRFNIKKNGYTRVLLLTTLRSKRNFFKPTFNEIQTIN